MQFNSPHNQNKLTILKILKRLTIYISLRSTPSFRVNDTKMLNWPVMPDICAYIEEIMAPGGWSICIMYAAEGCALGQWRTCTQWWYPVRLISAGRLA